MEEDDLSFAIARHSLKQRQFLRNRSLTYAKKGVHAKVFDSDAEIWWDYLSPRQRTKVLASFSRGFSYNQAKNLLRRYRNLPRELQVAIAQYHHKHQKTIDARKGFDEIVKKHTHIRVGEAGPERVDVTPLYKVNRRKKGRSGLIHSTKINLPRLKLGFYL